MAFGGKTKGINAKNELNDNWLKDASRHAYILPPGILKTGEAIDHTFDGHIKG